MLIKHKTYCHNCGIAEDEACLPENPGCDGGYYSDHHFGRTIFYNLTPHDVVVKNLGTIPSDGVIRVNTEKRLMFSLAGVPVNRTDFFSDTEGYILPEEKNDVFYIVSLPIAQAYKGLRNDLLITDGPIRNEHGQIIGCEGFGVL